MSFTNPCSPLTAIVIVHIVYINETTSPPTPPRIARQRRQTNTQQAYYCSLTRVKRPSTHGQSMARRVFDSTEYFNVLKYKFHYKT